MPVLKSSVDTQGEAFEANRERMLALLEEVRTLEGHVRERSERKAEEFRERGQLLPRDRVALLLDRGAPFLELSRLAGYKMHGDDGEAKITGGGCIVGIGFVAGRRCVVNASDSAIKGGAVSPMGLKKILRAQEIALESKLPMVNLVESAGANLMYQSELFIEGGRVFANMARMSAAGIVQVTVVHGSSTAGGAYIPGLSDYVVVVRGKAKIFLAGPPLVKAATGEDATDEELGGAEMHATVCGTAEYLAEDDAHAIEVAREIMSKLPGREHEATGHPGNEREERELRGPEYDPEELLGIVPADLRKPYDVREVIARIVDRSDFLEFKAGYGRQTICGHARLEGHVCGIVGNNGPIDPAGAVKAAHFIQACCQSGTPIIYLQNTPGYMVGVRAERQGMVKHGAKMIQAVANATVPQITILIGASFGAGNYGMCGRSYDPRFVFAWPNSRVALMGGAQAAKVMALLAESKMERAGESVDPKELEQMTRPIKETIDAESSALFATARLWDDGIIDPRDTRNVLALALSVCREAAGRTLCPSAFGVARM